MENKERRTKTGIVICLWLTRATKVGHMGVGIGGFFGTGSCQAALREGSGQEAVWGVEGASISLRKASQSPQPDQLSSVL